MQLPEPNKTHREIKKPEMHVRFLADYMAAASQGRHRVCRTTLQACRYKSLARVFHHKEAKAAIRTHFTSGGSADVSKLLEKAHAIRARMTDDHYEMSLNEYNADYIEKFVQTYTPSTLTNATIHKADPLPIIDVAGVRLKFETHATLRRVMKKTNRQRVGALMLRYRKDKPLEKVVGDWQSALLFGFMRKHTNIDQEEPEQQLCVTLDVVSGSAFRAPTDSVSRFIEAEAACATITAAWPNIKPPTNSVL